MNEKKSLAFVFIFLFTITLISIFFLVLNINLLFVNMYYQIILFLTFLNLLIAIIFFRRFLAEVIYDIDEKKSSEKNVKDCFLYHQLLNPPEYNN